MQDKIHWLALNLIPKVSNKYLYKLVEHFGSPQEVFSAPLKELEHVEGVPSKIAAKIKEFDKKSALKKELAQIDKHNVSIITYDDLEYPENLRSICDPPLVLYVKGEFKTQDHYSIAMVGSRRSTAYGRYTTKELAAQLSQNGITVVSGMARGIDSISHRSVIENKGRTLAVLGCGIDVVYPPENHQLMKSISEAGAVVSEFHMSTPPYAYNFPIRNRIISGLSLGVIVVEAALRSGTMITVGCALEQGREVFAVPGQISSKYSHGTHALIKQGAKLVEGVNDILEELKLPLTGLRVHSADDAETVDLNPQEKNILDVLSYDNIHIDEIIMNSQLPASKVLSILVSLEIKNCIRQSPGKFFCRID